MSLYSFIGNPNTESIDQLPYGALSRPCPLSLYSVSFEENEGGYIELLEDCTTFNQYGGHPPWFLENFIGIAPVVS